MVEKYLPSSGGIIVIAIVLLGLSLAPESFKIPLAVGVLFVSLYNIVKNMKNGVK